MNKRIRIAILIIWTLVGIGLITTVALTNKFDFSKSVITNIVLIYIFASCILVGVIYRLKHKK